MSKHIWKPTKDFDIERCKLCGSYIMYWPSKENNLDSNYYTYFGMSLNKEPNCNEEILKQIL